MNDPRTETSFPAQPRQRKLRVLCAEDDDHVALMLQIALGRAGHVVERAVDGQAALERIAEDLNFFDLLVTDHRMPRLSGRGLVEKLRDTAFLGKIVVHSSQLRELDEAAYRGLAVDHIFTKPMPLAELLGIVERMGATVP